MPGLKLSRTTDKGLGSIIWLEVLRAWSNSPALNLSISASQLCLLTFKKKKNKTHPTLERYLEIPRSPHSSPWEWRELSTFQHVALKNIAVTSRNHCLSCATVCKVKAACLKVGKLCDLPQALIHFIALQILTSVSCFLLRASLCRLSTCVGKPACDPPPHKNIIRGRKAVNFYFLKGLGITKINTLSYLLSLS